MKAQMKIAVKTFLHIWNEKEVYLIEAEEADAGFDGGEFSRPFHASLQQDKYSETVHRVADRFNIFASELWDAIEEYQHEGWRYYVNSLPTIANEYGTQQEITHVT